MKVGAGDTAMKVCTKCGASRAPAEFRERPLKSGNGTFRIGKCGQCERDEAAEYRRAHLEKVKAAVKKWKVRNAAKNAEHSRRSYARCKDARRQNMAEWKGRNPQKYAQINRNSAERHKQQLSLSYVRSCLRVPGTGKRIPDTPKLLIELQRAKLQIYRATKQLLQTIKEKSE